MSDPFSQIISKLATLGFFNFLTFLLALTIIYALLKQRKIFGESALMNGIVAFSIAFFIFAYPVIAGISLVAPLTAFLSQAFVFILLFFIGFLIASFFYPNFPEMLGGFFKSRNVLFAMIGLSLALFVTSGLVGIIYTTTQQQQPAQTENFLLITGLIIAVVVLLIAGSVGRG